MYVGNTNCLKHDRNGFGKSDPTKNIINQAKSNLSVWSKFSSTSEGEPNEVKLNRGKPDEDDDEAES